MDYFIRSQAWISPARGINEAQADDPELDADYNYVENEIEKSHEDPEYLLKHRKALSNRRVDEFKASLAGPEVLAGVKRSYVASMLERLGTKKARDYRRFSFPTSRSAAAGSRRDKDSSRPW